jgi:molybdate transport system permease protein
VSPTEHLGAWRRLRHRWFGCVLFLALALALAFLVLPVLAIFLNTSPARLLTSLGDAQSLDALRLSLETSAIAVAIIVLVGTPAAYLLARKSFRGQAAILTLLELPLVLPPAVAGIGLLAALGPHGILGGALAAVHVRLDLSTAAVVVALTFVAAPFYLRQAHAAFAAVDRSYLEAAQALGARESGLFRRVALPLARPGLTAGVALAWARALGEFGATLMFAGSFQGVTQTAPLAIYDEFANDFPAALALAAILVIVSGAVLLTVKLLVGTEPSPLGAAGAQPARGPADDQPPL